MLQQPEPLFTEDTVRTPGLANQPALKICCLRADACDVGPHTLCLSREVHGRERKCGRSYSPDPSGSPASLSPVGHWSVLSSPCLVLSAWLWSPHRAHLTGLRPLLPGPTHLLLSVNDTSYHVAAYHLRHCQFSCFRDQPLSKAGNFPGPSTS